MTTGDQYANVTNKRIMSFEDMSTRTINYLQEKLRTNTKLVFGEGSFFEPMALSSSGTNEFNVDVKPTQNDYVAHDGAGNILDLQNFANDVVFENTAATTYEIGAAYVKKPVGIVVNPRTGKPDYDRWEESVGVEGDPDSVVDNGSNLTIRVDVLNAAGGESLAGRVARVFKKIPADAALTAAEAIEEVTISYSGGQNTITTTGLLGQTTPSTTASDYTVQLVGLTVRRITNPDRVFDSSTHFFIGTVIGNGGTPSVFDISNQLVILGNSSVVGTELGKSQLAELAKARWNPYTWNFTPSNNLNAIAGGGPNTAFSGDPGYNFIQVLAVGENGQLSPKLNTGFVFYNQLADAGYVSDFEAVMYCGFNFGFVVCGELEEIQTMAEFDSAVQRNTGGTQTLRYIAYDPNNDRVVISGGSKLYESTAPGTWTTRTISGVSSYSKVVFAEGLFVIVTDLGIYTSADGISWTQRLASVVYSDVVYIGGLGKFVAGNSTSMSVSDDGLTWTTINFGSGKGPFIGGQAIACRGGLVTEDHVFEFVSGNPDSNSVRRINIPPTTDPNIRNQTFDPETKTWWGVSISGIHSIPLFLGIS